MRTHSHTLTHAADATAAGSPARIPAHSNDSHKLQESTSVGRARPKAAEHVPELYKADRPIVHAFICRTYDNRVPIHLSSEFKFQSVRSSLISDLATVSARSVTWKVCRLCQVQVTTIAGVQQLQFKRALSSARRRSNVNSREARFRARELERKIDHVYQSVQSQAQHDPPDVGSPAGPHEEAHPEIRERLQLQQQRQLEEQPRIFWTILHVDAQSSR